MIILDHVTKSYRGQNGGRTTVLDDFSGVLQPGNNIGILGRNGAGKSTLMRLLSGAEAPTSGGIYRAGNISWPLGFSGGFNGSLTARQNLRFIADIYDADYLEITDFVERFSGLGRYMNEPVKTYSSGMRARLAFGASMAIQFDFYLIDEVIAVGDKAFQEKCHQVFAERREQATVVLVSHSSRLLKTFCDVAGILDNGHLLFYSDLDEAIEVHEGRQAQGSPTW